MTRNVTSIIFSIVFITGVFFVVDGFVCRSVWAQEKPTEDPNKLFYTGNYYYQKQDYLKAVEEYLKLLDKGIINGSLYYNIGNSFLKLGRTGYALLCYEKAKRFIPNDSDLRANSAYARSLVSDTIDSRSTLARLNLMLKPYEGLNLQAIAILTLIPYLILSLLLAIFIINPLLGRKIGFIAVLTAILFLINAFVFGIRFYDEEILTHGVVVQKSIECKYEPIDKSTTYFKMGEGNDVVVLSTKDGWRHIRRADGKTGWVSKEAVEEI